MRKFVLASFFTFCFNISSQAQEQTATLDDVVVLSDRLQIPVKQHNRNIQIITADQIANMPIKSVSELLSFAAGVDVRQRGPNGTQADIGIDGGTFDQTLVLVNGFKMSDPQTGHNMMNLPVPLEAIERIEILKGAAARVYGVNAFMGVINIVTKSTKENSFVANLYGGSSFQKDETTATTYANLGVQVVGQIASKKFSHLLGASWDQGNGYRYNTAYTNSRLVYSGKGNVTANTRLEWLAGYAGSAFGANAFYAAPRDKESEETVNTYILGLRVPIQVSPKWQIRPAINYKNGYDHYVFVRQNPAIFQNKHRTQVVDASVDNVIATNWGNIAAGINYRKESINSSNLGERTRDNYAAFLEYQWNNLDQWNFTAGLFLNHNSVFGTKLYPGIDIGYKLNDTWRLYANAGMGQRLPTFTDLYYTGPSNIGNALLSPESLISYELGTKLKQKNWQLNTALFYKLGSDFIDWVRPDTMSPWTVENFTSLNTFGIHLDAQYKHQWNKSGLALYSGYTYLNPQLGSIADASKQDWSSQYAINALRHQWVLRANLNVNNKWNVLLGSRFLSRINGGASVAGYKRTGYQLLDASLSYNVKKIRVYLDVNNIFNVKYIESGVVPLPGTWITVGLRAKV